MSGATALWDAHASYERVALEDLAVELQVGVNDWERTPGKAQRLLISVEMFRHRGEFTGSSLADCVDYGRVYRHVIERWTPARAHVDLLEVVGRGVGCGVLRGCADRGLPHRDPQAARLQRSRRAGGRVYRLRSDISSGTPRTRGR